MKEIEKSILTDSTSPLVPNSPAKSRKRKNQRKDTNCKSKKKQVINFWLPTYNSYNGVFSSSFE